MPQVTQRQIANRIHTTLILTKVTYAVGALTLQSVRISSQ